MKYIMKYIGAFVASLLMPLFVLAQHSQYSLEQCIEMALINNARIQRDSLSFEMAMQDKAEALTAYFPQVAAGATGFVGAKDMIRTEVELPPALGGMTLPFSMIKKGVVATVTALQPLYMGGQIITANKLARLQTEVCTLQREMTRRDVVQNVETYYWKLVALRGNISTLDAAEKQLDEVHRYTENYLNAGVINRNDLLRVEIKQSELASQRLTLNNGIELVRMVLAQMCGASMKDFDIIESNILDPLAPDTYLVPTDEAVQRREETQLLAKKVTSNELKYKNERGKLLPNVAIGASGLYMNLTEENQGNLVGLATVSVPISAWWGGSHRLRKARMATEQSRIEQRDSQEKLQIDVMNAWNNLQEAYAQIEIARRTVAQSDENLRMGQDQYKAGTQDLTVLLDAVTLYTQSHNQLVKTCADYQSRIAEYKRKTATD